VETQQSPIRVAINGFGRIGRTFFRLSQSFPEIKVVAINDLADAPTLAHLLKYDSIHGRFNGTVSSTLTDILVGEDRIPVFHEKEPKNLPWQALKVDIVLESTGKFKTAASLNGHLVAGANRVVLSSPPDDDLIPIIVVGINDEMFSSQQHMVSNASCTTNNAAPMLQLIQELCGINQAYITTVHSYTTDQSLHDQPHRDLRRARAAGQSIVPTTTGAAKALTSLFPELEKKLGGCGIRVPVPDGSLTDITCSVQRPISIQELNMAFQQASLGRWKGIVEYTEDPIVSVDVLHNTHSCVFDAQLTSVIDTMVKVVGWYDNETGYSSRLIDLMIKWQQKI
jgi:glyceraldehyde 3-phosphate dehydrogenase